MPFATGTGCLERDRSLVASCTRSPSRFTAQLRFCLSLRAEILKGACSYALRFLPALVEASRSLPLVRFLHGIAGVAVRLPGSADLHPRPEYCHGRPAAEGLGPEALRRLRHGHFR